MNDWLGGDGNGIDGKRSADFEDGKRRKEKTGPPRAQNGTATEIDP